MENLVIKLGTGWFEKWMYSQPIITPIKKSAKIFTDLREAEAVENDLIRIGWTNPVIQSVNDECERKHGVTVNILTKFREQFFKAGRTYTTEEMIDWWSKEIQFINNIYTQEMNNQLSLIIADCIIDSQKITTSIGESKSQLLLDNVHLMFDIKKKIEKLFGVEK